jgi:hypothetical protein
MFDPITMGAISLGGGALVGALSAQESPQQKAYQSILDYLQKNRDFFAETPYSKDEIAGVTQRLQQMAGGAADVAAGKIGAAIGEADIAGGQPFGEYYTQALAPVIAEGEQNKIGIEQSMMNFLASLDANAKQRLLQSLGLEAQVASGLDEMSSGQKFTAGLLQGTNLFATGFGNIADAYAKTQTKPITVG